MSRALLRVDPLGMAVERRKHSRRRLAVRLHWKLVDLEQPNQAQPLASDDMHAAVALDRSDGGIAFRVERALPVGGVVALRLEREAGGPPLAALGRVARCDATDRGFVVGAELTWVEAVQLDVGLGTQPESAWMLL